MLDEITFALLAIAWIACTFAALQLVELRAWGSIGAVGISVAVGVVVIATRDQAIGFNWIRSASLRSDAYALAALPAMVATTSGVLAQGAARRSTWGPNAAAVACVGGAGVAVAALAIGRSGWYWEFVTVIAAGALLCVIGVLTALRRDAAVELRLAHGCLAAFGAFLAVGGALMCIAWRSIA